MNGNGEISVLDQLGTDICSGRLAAGSLLYLVDLSEEFGVAQSVVREAVKVLSSMGMVESRQRRGTIVRPQDMWNLFDPRIIDWRLSCHQRAQQLQEMLELRMAIEPLAAKLAAQRMTSAELAALKALGEDFLWAATEGSEQDFLAADIAFHKMLLRGSKNLMLRQLDELVAEVLSARHKYRLTPVIPNPDSVRLHLVLVEAILEGDAESALAAARLIVERASKELMLFLNDAEPSEV